MSKSRAGRLALFVVAALALASGIAGWCGPTEEKASANALRKLLMSVDNKPGLTADAVDAMLKTTSKEFKLKQPVIAEDYLAVQTEPRIPRIAARISSATSSVIEDEKAKDIARGVYCDLLLQFVLTRTVPSEQDIVASVGRVAVKEEVSIYRSTQLVDEVTNSLNDLEAGHPTDATLRLTLLLSC